MIPVATLDNISGGECAATTLQMIVVEDAFRQISFWFGIGCLCAGFLMGITAMYVYHRRMSRAGK